MAAKKAVKVVPPAKEVFISTTWSGMVRMWSVQGSAVLAAVAGAYAGSSELQSLVPATAFALFMAVANLVLIVLRTLNQTPKL